MVCDSGLLPVVETSGFSGHVVIADGESDDHRSIADIRELVRHDHSAEPADRPCVADLGHDRHPEGSPPFGSSDGAVVGARGPRTDALPGRRHRVIPTPLFHAWGLAQLTIAAATGSTAVLVRRFTVDATLDAIEAEGGACCVVPVMLQRILAAETHDRDTSSLRIVACSGSALPAAVASAWMDRFGDHLYNLYGSTEVGQATLATPEDLRAAPGTAGRVIAGTVVEIVGERGEGVPAGEDGLIVVGSDAQFTEYTGGGTKERIRGLMSSGDVGHFDADGRLFVTGRADDMIVSGGENVFPLEIEEVLLSHAACGRRRRRRARPRVRSAARSLLVAVRVGRSTPTRSNRSSPHGSAPQGST